VLAGPVPVAAVATRTTATPALALATPTPATWPVAARRALGYGRRVARPAGLCRGAFCDQTVILGTRHVLISH
jgi:hypothetical protein